jgi:hypothetical protein
LNYFKKKIPKTSKCALGIENEGWVIIQIGKKQQLKEYFLMKF